MICYYVTYTAGQQACRHVHYSVAVLHTGNLCLCELYNVRSPLLLLLLLSFRACRRRPCLPSLAPFAVRAWA
jgi:hypothetical protein